ncbi:MAG: histidine phosphatase family protein [Dehalococcoidia bacterium]
MSDGVRIWCLRHGEAEHGTTGTAEADSTAQLTARGRRQAIAAGRTLAAAPITRIYTSTAVRARQTADLLATTLAPTPALPITAMPELVEAGCTADVLRAWVVEQDLGRRGADGETRQQVVTRVTAALETIAGAHPGETVAVVGHVASLTVALGRLCGLGAGYGAHPCRTRGPSSSSGTAMPGTARPGLPSGNPCHTPLDHWRSQYPIYRSELLLS